MNHLYTLGHDRICKSSLNRALIKNIKKKMCQSTNVLQCQDVPLDGEGGGGEGGGGEGGGGRGREELQGIGLWKMNMVRMF